MNAALHLANTLLLFGLLRRMTGRTWRSAAVAALFAAHPLHVESVAWIAERKDVVSTLFGLLSLRIWVWYAARPGAARYLAAAVCFALSLASKSMLVTLPFVMLLLDFWPLGRIAGRRLVLEKIPLLGLSAAASLVAFFAQQGQGAMTLAGQYPLSVRAANAAAAYLAYLGKAVWPFRLSVMYPHPGTALASWKWLCGAALVVLATALALGLRRRLPWLTTGTLWFLGTLVPAIGLVQVGEQAFADRYTYVPLIGVFLAAAWGLPPLFSSPRLRRVLAAATLAAVCAGGTLAARQILHWKDNRSLYRHALEVAPESWIMRANLAGELIAAGELSEALGHQRAAARLRPELPETSHNLGVVLAGLNRHEEAIAAFGETIRLMPHHQRADYNLGRSLKALGRLAEALPHFERGVSRNPDSADALTELGATLLGLGRLNEGAAKFALALQLDAQRAGSLNFTLGNAYAQAGFYDLAIAAFQESLRTGPAFAIVYNALGSSYANSGRYREAEEAYTAALRIQPNQPDVRRNLALVKQKAAER